MDDAFDAYLEWLSKNWEDFPPPENSEPIVLTRNECELKL